MKLRGEWRVTYPIGRRTHTTKVRSCGLGRVHTPTASIESRYETSYLYTDKNLYSMTKGSYLSSPWCESGNLVLT